MGDTSDSAASPSSGTTSPSASYIPPHMREGYKSQAAVPPRSEHKKMGTTNSRRGRVNSNQKRDSVDANTARLSVDGNSARPQFKKSTKESTRLGKTNDIIQESMYLCLDTED